MRVSHETIYQSLFVQTKGELKRELTAHLRSRRTARKAQTGAAKRVTLGITDDIRISARPAEADDRAVAGHWEGDLLLGSTGKGAVVTLVERSTRFVLLAPLPGRHTAEVVRWTLNEMIATLPPSLRKSITWDRGSEMAQHARFTVDSGIPIYFCDPRSPWQRDSNENTNGLLRQYWPKGEGPAAPHHGSVRRRRAAAQHPPPQDPAMADSRAGSQQEPRCSSRLNSPSGHCRTCRIESNTCSIPTSMLSMR